MTIGFVDGKYFGHIRKIVDQRTIDPADVIVLRARDNAVVPALEAYLAECRKIGCSVEFLRAVNDLIARAQQWRDENPTLCKIPD